MPDTIAGVFSVETHLDPKLFPTESSEYASVLEILYLLGV